MAYSGGADSTVLLHTVAALRRGYALEAIALHIHHGLSPNADSWTAHCKRECESLDLPFFHERVVVAVGGGKSLEAEARRARYATLQRLACENRASLLMTAHHGDDQAETVLLNLMRGAGLAGLAGAAPRRPLGASSGLTLVRPFQHIGGEALRRQAQSANLAFMEDESNLDRRHTRNALRHEVMPALKRIFPAATRRLAQSAAHLAEAQELLDDIGREDLQAIGSRTGSRTAPAGNPPAAELHLEALRKLPRSRAANALRFWFRSQSRHAPSTAALNEMLSQFLESRSGAQISLIHDDLVLQVYRGRVHVRPLADLPQTEPAAQQYRWSGEAFIELPAWKGRLAFEPASALGISAAALRSEPLSIRGRQGGERLKLHPDRPSRSLKNLYQEQAIPPWQRSQLPLLYLGDKLVFAAGLGMDVRHQTSAAEGNAPLTIGWQPVVSSA